MQDLRPESNGSREQYQDIFGRGVDTVPHGLTDVEYKGMLAGRPLVDKHLALTADVDLDSENEADIVAPADPGGEIHDFDLEVALEELLDEEEDFRRLEGVSDGGPEEPLPPEPPEPGGAEVLPPGIVGPAAGPAAPPPPLPPPPIPLGDFLDGDADPEHALRTRRWGVFSVVPKQAHSAAQHGGYQARCVFHRIRVSNIELALASFAP